VGKVSSSDEYPEKEMEYTMLEGNLNSVMTPNEVGLLYLDECLVEYVDDLIDRFTWAW
jgi:hypothetical protein